MTWKQLLWIIWNLLSAKIKHNAIILEFCARSRVEDARTTRNQGYRSNLPYFFIRYRLHVRKCTDAIAVRPERRFVALWSAAKSFPTAARPLRPLGPLRPLVRSISMLDRCIRHIFERLSNNFLVKMWYFGKILSE